MIHSEAVDCPICQFPSYPAETWVSTSAACQFWPYICTNPVECHTILYQLSEVTTRDV